VNRQTVHDFDKQHCGCGAEVEYRSCLIDRHVKGYSGIKIVPHLANTTTCISLAEARYAAPGNSACTADTRASLSPSH
jgi:hypothetical protein